MMNINLVVIGEMLCFVNEYIQFVIICRLQRSNNRRKIKVIDRYLRPPTFF